MTSATLPAIAALTVTLIASATDLRAFRVPNRLTISALAAGLLYHAASTGWGGLFRGLEGAGFGFLLLIGVYAIGGMGAGDVKLLAAVGAWVGPAETWRIFLVSAMAGGVYALAILALRAWGPGLVGAVRAGMPSTVAEGVARPDRRLRLIPYAAMMAIGVAVAEGPRLAAHIF